MKNIFTKKNKATALFLFCMISHYSFFVGTTVDDIGNWSLLAGLLALFGWYPAFMWSVNNKR